MVAKRSMGGYADEPKPEALYAHPDNRLQFAAPQKSPGYFMGRKQASGRALIQDYMGTCTLQDINVGF